jgi:hypothetical protein
MKQALPRWVIIAAKQRPRSLLSPLQPIHRAVNPARAILWAGLLASGGALVSCSGPPVQTEAKLMQKLAGTWHLDKLAAANMPLFRPIRKPHPASILTHTQAAKPSRPRLTSVDLIFQPDGQVYALPAGANPVAMDYEIDVTQDPPQLILYTADRGIYHANFSLVGDNELQFHGGAPRPFLRQPVSLQRQSYATEPPVALPRLQPTPLWVAPTSIASYRLKWCIFKPISGLPIGSKTCPTSVRFTLTNTATKSSPPAPAPRSSSPPKPASPTCQA